MANADRTTKDLEPVVQAAMHLDEVDLGAAAHATQREIVQFLVRGNLEAAVLEPGETPPAPLLSASLHPP